MDLRPVYVAVSTNAGRRMREPSELPSQNAEGANRARSASEAFLYWRLETLAATNGKFRLNSELPIPFDGWGTWKLICFARHRIAIELDGGQHFGDAGAYR